MQFLLEMQGKVTALTYAHLSFGRMAGIEEV